MNRYWLALVIGLTATALAQNALTKKAPAPTTGKSTSPRTARTAPTPATMTPLAEGGTAYLRAKEYTAKPLKNATPAGDASEFQFGDEFTLVAKRDALPVFWLVSKDQAKAWLPSYLLTTNVAELDFLKSKDRIPGTMAFVYKDDNWKVWGDEKMSMGGFSMTVSSEGLALLDYPEGTSPFALKGNAVMFDPSALETGGFQKPPVFDSAKKGFRLSPTRLYYAIAGGDKSAFECFDLTTLKPCLQ